MDKLITIFAIYWLNKSGTENNKNKNIFVAIKDNFHYLFLETLILCLVFVYPWQKQTPVSLIISIGLILSGWTLTNWFANYRNKLFKRVSKVGKRLLGGLSPLSNHRLIGDALQVLALTLFLENKALALLTLPLFTIAHSISKPQSAIPILESSKNLWLPFSSVFIRLLFVISLAVILALIVTSDLRLFSYGNEEGWNLVSILLQIEATVGVLAISLMFVVVQLASTEFSMRLTSRLASRKEFKVVVLASIGSAAFKILTLANPSVFPIVAGRFLGVELSLLFTLLVGLSYYYFGRASIMFMSSPELLTIETLRGFNLSWMIQVRELWQEGVTPTSLNIRDDPLVMTERILNTALKNEDSNTFLSSLIYLRKQILDLRANTDGPILDNYLSHHFSSTVRAACSLKLVGFGKLILVYLGGLTEINDFSIYKVNGLWSGTPVGIRFYKEILDNALVNDLDSLAIDTIHAINERAANLIRELPKHEEIWNLNPDNNKKEVGEEERDRLRQNDSIVETYVHGYLEAFRAAGVWAAKRQKPEVTKTITRALFHQIVLIINTKHLEGYQFALTNYVMFTAQAILYELAEAKVSDGFSFDMYFSNRDKVNSETAGNILGFLGTVLTELSEAGLLDWYLVTNISMAGYYLGEFSAQGVVSLLKAFEKAGETLVANPALSKNRKLKIALSELHSRADQVAAANVDDDFNETVADALTKAKQKTKYAN